MPNVAEALGATVGAFVDALAESGLRHVAACPGSRSTPLASACAHDPRITLWMHLDERSAAFFGLGLARALGEPVGLLATSGTAAANFLPAVVESSFSRVPLLVLTADRPHELRDCGAPQTIDQVRLYGQHVRWFVDLPEPDLSDGLLDYVCTIGARALASACAEPAGPVHVNWPFREPLVPSFGASSFARARHAVRVSGGPRSASDELLTQLSNELAASERVLIVCGPQDDRRLPASVVRLADRLQVPVVADVLSGMRFGAHAQSLVVDAYDAFLRHDATVERLQPQVVLRLGAMPTSKPLLQYLQRYPRARHIVVDPGGWRDPTGLATDVLHVDPVGLCRVLADRLDSRPRVNWTSEWLHANRVAGRATQAKFDDLDELFEGQVFAELAAVLPSNALLYLGNSMPVRDADTFLGASAAGWRVLGNRGASGIDGVVSSALGASAADLGPVVLVIGDLSFYHDLNGLLAARQHGLDLLVVLINNDGGGIFSFLPQAGLDDFEPLFGTPHGLDFEPFVTGYGGRFTRVNDWHALRTALEEDMPRRGLRVIEVPTDRQRNVVLHRQIWQDVARALAATPVA